MAGEKKKMAGQEVKMAGHEMKISGQEVNIPGEKLKVSGHEVKIAGQEVKIAGHKVKMSVENMERVVERVKLRKMQIYFQGWMFRKVGRVFLRVIWIGKPEFKKILLHRFHMYAFYFFSLAIWNL
jgi:hypothetical protein